MDIIKLKKFNFLMKEVAELGQLSKNLDCENRRLDHVVEILKNLNDVCECIVALYCFSMSTEKLD